MRPDSPDDPWVAAIQRSLETFVWRALRTEMLARYIVAALDRQWVRLELAKICGEDDFDTPLEPALPADERVAVVEQALSACRWRSLTVQAVGGQALCALKAWADQRNWLEIELSWLLDEGA